ncbi:hypothetical protein [Yoonia sp. SS1-5]|uniref:Uncharacterized protein n=1 Tax=Yoonia rhodophyticola TaxID=3137370 RepID=A0AAN0M7M2_9RHOB
MANLGQDNFNARIKRIKSPSNKAYFDPELQMHVPKHTSQEQIRKDIKAQKFSIIRLLISVLIGVIAVIVGQSLRYRYLEMVEVSNASLFTDILVSLFVVLLLSALLRHRRTTLRAAQLLGAVAMLLGGHNLMWAYPDELAIVYTSEYVQTVRAQTTPMTLVFRDVQIALPGHITGS